MVLESVMRKHFIVSAAIGGIIGSIIIIIFLALLNQKAPLETKDLLSFVLATVSIVIAVLTVLGAVILVTTWNDIDERTDKIVAKYEKRTSEAIQKMQQDSTAEIERNANERQEAIDKTYQLSKAHIEQIGKKFEQRSRWFTIASVLLLVSYPIVDGIYRFLKRKKKT